MCLAYRRALLRGPPARPPLNETRRRLAHSLLVRYYPCLLVVERKCRPRRHPPDFFGLLFYLS